MEELLRACAKKRRDEAGAPFELSAEVRARLQEEVRSALRKPAAAPPPRWGLSLAGWLRLALAGSVAVLVILMLRSNTAPPASSRQQLAQADEKKAATAAPTAAPLARKPSSPTPELLADAAKMPVAAAAPVVPPTTVAPPAGNPVSAMRQLSRSEEAAPKAEFDKLLETPKLAAAGDLAVNRTAGSVESAIASALPGGGGGGGFGGGGARGGGGGRGGRGGAAGAVGANPDSRLAAISPPAAGNVNLSGLAASSTALDNAQSAVPFAQQMARSEPALRAPSERDREAKAPSSAVLATFQIERNGDQVRIVDADGSAYEGRVVAPETPDQSQAGLAARRAAKDLSAAPAAPAPAQPNAPQGNNFAVNLAAQSKGPVNAPANAAEPRAAAANPDSFARNQVAANQSNLAGPQPAGDENGFAFQVNGLNRKLNQSVNIIGNCVPMPLLQNANMDGGNFVAGGNFSIQNSSNQIQAAPGANNAVVLSARPPAGQSLAASNVNNIVNYQNIAPPPAASPAVQNAQNGLNSANLQNMNSIARSWRVTGEVQVGASNRFNLDASTVQP